MHIAPSTKILAKPSKEIVFRTFSWEKEIQSSASLCGTGLSRGHLHWRSTVGHTDGSTRGVTPKGNSICVCTRAAWNIPCNSDKLSRVRPNVVCIRTLSVARLQVTKACKGVRTLHDASHVRTPTTPAMSVLMASEHPKPSQMGSTKSMFKGVTLLPNPLDESLTAPWRWHQHVLVPSDARPIGL